MPARKESTFGDITEFDLIRFFLVFVSLQKLGNLERRKSNEGFSLKPFWDKVKPLEYDYEKLGILLGFIWMPWGVRTAPPRRLEAERLAEKLCCLEAEILEVKKRAGNALAQNWSFRNKEYQLKEIGLSDEAIQREDWWQIAWMLEAKRITKQLCCTPDNQFSPSFGYKLAKQFQVFRSLSYQLNNETPLPLLMEEVERLGRMAIQKAKKIVEVECSRRMAITKQRIEQIHSTPDFHPILEKILNSQVVYLVSICETPIPLLGPETPFPVLLDKVERLREVAKQKTTKEVGPGFVSRFLNRFRKQKRGF